MELQCVLQGLSHGQVLRLQFQMTMLIGVLMPLTKSVAGYMSKVALISCQQVAER
jgi:hypothetical protein